MESATSLLTQTLSLGVIIIMATQQAPASGSTYDLRLTPDSLVLENGPLSLPVSLDSPTFTFGGRTVGGTAPSSVKGDDPARRVDVRYAPTALGGSSKLEVKLVLKWSAKESVLRKIARFRVLGVEAPVKVDEVVLESLDAAGRNIDFRQTTPQNQPAFMDGFFAGIEYPVASSRLDGEQLVLAYKPGRKLQPGVWHETRTAVYGICAKGDERRCFERYIEGHRPAPKGFHVNYNSWWTGPIIFTEQDMVELADVFEEKLYKPYGRIFDSFAIDHGWSDDKTVWEISNERLPNGFSMIRSAIEKTGANLGLWISPSSCYPGALDSEYAGEHGYEDFDVPWPGGARMHLLCLGGEKYARRFGERMHDMAEEFLIKHVKLDGCVLNCPKTDHGHEPGDASADAIAEGAISAFVAARKAVPDIWLEPTCFGPSPSPWWLFYVNSVTGSFGDDSPYGRAPSPVYRESYTTARDYYNLQGAYQLPIPVSAQEVLGIVHQSNEPFMNDAVITILRGNMFIPVYINPDYMDDRRWKDFADLVKWARKNTRTLQTTEAIIPSNWQTNGCPQFTHDAAMPREPYGYAHWTANQGLIALRNPWITKAEFTLDLKPMSGDDSISIVSIYPEPRAYGSDLHAGDRVEITLAPYETVVLSVKPGQPAKSIPDVSQEIRSRFQLPDLTASVTKAEYDGEPMGPTADTTDLLGDAKSGYKVSIDSEIAVDAPEAEILVLLEGGESPEYPVCRLMIDGRDMPMSASGSETGWAATGAAMPDHWLFLRAPLKPGKQRVSVELLTRGDASKVSAWVWAKKTESNGAKMPNTIPPPEVFSLDSAQLLPETDLGSVTATERVQRPIERIDGVYVDSLDLTVSPEGALKTNESIAGTPISITGRRFVRGLGVVGSKVTVPLDGKFRRFQSWVGMDTACIKNYFDRSRPTFEVWVDGVKRWDSGTMLPGDDARFADVDVAGGKSMDLVIRTVEIRGHNGSNWCDWGDARLLR